MSERLGGFVIFLIFLLTVVATIKSISTLFAGGGIVAHLRSVMGKLRNKVFTVIGCTVGTVVFIIADTAAGGRYRSYIISLMRNRGHVVAICLFFAKGT